MEPTVTKFTAEYEAALASVTALMSAVPGTPDGEGLKLWVRLVEAYRDTRYPIAAPELLEAIRFPMEQQRLK